MANRIRILLVDDHQVLREGLAALINTEKDLTVIGEASSGDEAVQLAIELKPDIIIMDLGLPGQSGLTAIRSIRQLGVPSRIVVLSMHNDYEIVSLAWRAGCDAYIPKASTHTDLLEAIRVVHAGGRYLHTDSANQVVSELSSLREKALLVDQLSFREIQVLRMTALGYTSKEIGYSLSISPKTVETYRQRIAEKLNLTHRSELVRFANYAGLLDELETKKSSV